MSKKDKKIYASNQMNYFEQKPNKIKTYSEKDYTHLPDPIRDSIVSNNITDREFNCTYISEEDIFNDNDYDDRED